MTKSKLLGFLFSLFLYVGFALAVYWVQGDEPPLGSDHLSYMKVAEEILRARPEGDYWRESNSVRSFPVLLDYVHGHTGDHVRSMKIILAVASVLSLLAMELLLGRFVDSKGKRVLFTLMSAFAVSFGVTSWGLTDSAALMNRTVVLPLVLFVFWFYLRFFDSPLRYLAYSFLVVGSLLHLSTFHVLGVLLAFECWDFAVLRKWRLDVRLAYCAAGLALAVATLLGLQETNLSVRLVGVVEQQIAPEVSDKFVSATGWNPGVTGEQGQVKTEEIKVVTAQEAWELELGMRAWRNMPLPLINIANILSSYSLILLLSIAGFAVCRRRGLDRMDQIMAGLAVSMLVAALTPQTLQWVARQFLEFYPFNIEEIRALFLLMIPSIYFTYRLFDAALHARFGLATRYALAGGIVVAFLALPLSMKSLPVSWRERILWIVQKAGVIDAGSEAAVGNARSALGLVFSSRFYYSTRGVREWLRTHAPEDAVVLTTLDDIDVIGVHTIGGRQAVALAVPGDPAGLVLKEAMFDLKRALATGETGHVMEMAHKYRADYAIVPWPADGVYSDADFSIVEAGSPDRRRERAEQLEDRP